MKCKRKDISESVNGSIAAVELLKLYPSDIIVYTLNDAAFEFWTEYECVKHDSIFMCPCCGLQFINQDIKKRRCLGCHHFIRFSSESLNTIIDHRSNQKLYSRELVHEKYRVWFTYGANIMAYRVK